MHAFAISIPTAIWLKRHGAVSTSLIHATRVHRPAEKWSRRQRQPQRQTRETLSALSKISASLKTMCHVVDARRRQNLSSKSVRAERIRGNTSCVKSTSMLQSSLMLSLDGKLIGQLDAQIELPAQATGRLPPKNNWNATTS